MRVARKDRESGANDEWFEEKGRFGQFFRPHFGADCGLVSAALARFTLRF